MSMNTTQNAPTAAVLSAFGLPEVTPRLLADGQGRSWSVTSAILRPVDDEAETRFIAQTYSRLKEDGFRVPQPLATPEGEYIHEGWCAWRYVPGHHDNGGDWLAMLDACEAFHKALAGIEPPGFLATERHHWALADRIAWNEERAPANWELAEAISRQLELVDNADRQMPRQLVHGDIAGNILYEEGLAPAVIDFSPYWRPAAWAMAVAVVDAVAWQSAPADLLLLAHRRGVSESLLRRSIAFRLAAVNASPLLGSADCQAELAAFAKLSAMLDRPHPLL